MKIKQFLLLISLIVSPIVYGQSSQGQNDKIESNSREGTLMLMVTLKTTLTEAELMVIAKKRAPEFRALSGIIQKYYLKLKEPNTYAGVYVWDNATSLNSYRKSELAATIAKAYKTTEPPSIEVMDILFKLRD